jgi:tetratricopeptide (TPR) repeat protein
VLVTLAAYYPAWHGGVLWDDDRHLTSAALQSAGGLWRIWFELGATQQYYPVVHSAFWVLHRLAGDSTAPYHLTNIVLHGSSAFLIACLLRRWRVPGAAVAGALFALHPVHVESVAWITELKNTLSGFFCLVAALAWARFDDRRDRGSYAACLLFFALALLSKSVTAMLPVALLIAAWWRRGRVEWRRDMRPLVPMLAAGAAAGLFTAWVEHAIIRARGAEYDLSLVERCLVAGRATWFYLGKLFVPDPLVFIYPRWHVSDGEWMQYLFPAAALVLAIGLWVLRTRWRGPAAAYAAFCALLFPALGFFNVYPFRFSYVADHFQYLASIPVLALVAAGSARLARRASQPAIGVTAAALLLCGLGTLTWRQSGDYADAATLYTRTLQRNPAAWLAAINLGVLELDRDPRAAEAHFRQALRYKPDNAEAHSDLGNALQRLGQLEDAASEYREAVRLDPELAEAHNNLSNVLARLGRADESAREAAEAVRLAPDNAEAQFNLGVALHSLGRPEAINHFAAAVRLRPDLAEAHNYLGIILQTMGHDDDALAEYGATVRLQPGHAGARFNLANLLQARGRVEEAIAHYRALLGLTPQDAAAHNNFGAALEAAGQRDEAAREYALALQLDPRLETARENLRRVSR